MTIAERSTPEDYVTFNDFFTRKLRPNTRPIAKEQETIISPIDGTISQIGNIQENTIIQAKGISYSLETLLVNKDYLELFKNGNFATLYLSPKDYHRIHLPIAGILQEMTYVPGRLFSVNPATADTIQNLFARNERAINIFKTEIGTMAVIMVGAMLVASINTAWGGKITPNNNKTIRSWQYDSQQIEMHRGMEIGYFELGSTVILLFEPNMMEWNINLHPNDSVQFGQSIGKINQI